jgi:septal ring factor EnvC (AmiA/AmiB activator)
MVVKGKDGVEIYGPSVVEAGGNARSAGRSREERHKQNVPVLLRFLVLFISLFTLHSSLFTFSQEPSALQRELETNIANSQSLLQQREQEIASIEAELGETATRLESQIAERDTVSSDLAALREENVVLTESITVLEGQLAETRTKLEGLQTQVADLKTRVQELLVGVYKQRTGRYAGVLAESDSLHDLQVKNYYLSLLSDQDYDLITQLSVTATELITTQETQNQQLSDLQAQKTALEGNQVALEIKQGDLETIIANLASTREGQLAMQKDLLESQASLETAIVELQSQREAEIARLQEEARKKRELAAQTANAIQQAQLEAEAAEATQRAENLAAPTATLPAMSAGYFVPVSNAQIYTPFGKQGSFLALRANTSGAAVYAVQPGIVLDASFLSANDGYLVSVQHADGTITAYSNLQGKLTVRSGDEVQQGDVLGYLGGGGIIPNDVLKFYVRTSGGSYVDPARVLGL